MDFLFPYDEKKLKPLLKMATQRIKIANNKRSTASSKHKREIGKLLEDCKREKAIIRVEHVIRDDYTMEAFEIIELMCDLLYERAKQLSKTELCPPDLVEAVSTIIWASSRVDIVELDGAKKQLCKKFGKEFCDLCVDDSRYTVNSRVIQKLNIAPPSNMLIRCYLQEIAKEYNVEWDDETFPIREDGTYREGYQLGCSVPMAPSSGLGGVYNDYGGGDGQGWGGGGGGSTVPLPMTMNCLPPAYEDSQLHPTTEVGQQQHQQQQQQMHEIYTNGPQHHQQHHQQQAPSGKYKEEDVPPPLYHEVVQPPSPSAQHQPHQPHQPHPQQQQQQQPQQQQPLAPAPPPAPTSAPAPASAAPSYDDLMARFKNLKN